MKSSTLYRSNLSKEKMVLLEELRAKSNSHMSNEARTPDGVYLITGFIAGALAMFLMTALLSFSSNAINERNNPDSPKLVKKVKPAKAKLSIIPADQIAEEAKPAAQETYTVKSGDTLEGIIIRFYGKYDTSKISKIMQANNMANPNQLSIGQSLVIPMD